MSWEVLLQEYIKRPDFQIWLHAKTVEEELRKFVLSIVSNEIKILRNKILTSNESEALHIKTIKEAGITCTECETPNLLECPTSQFCKKTSGVCQKHGDVKSWCPKPCPLSLCDRFKRKLTRKHKFKSPCWENTDAKCWATSDFEVAKCFLPKTYVLKKSLSEVDTVGLLHICINCKAFRVWISGWDQLDNTATQVICY